MDSGIPPWKRGEVMYEANHGIRETISYNSDGKKSYINIWPTYHYTLSPQRNIQLPTTDEKANGRGGVWKVLDRASSGRIFGLDMDDGMSRDSAVM